MLKSKKYEYAVSSSKKFIFSLCCTSFRRVRGSVLNFIGNRAAGNKEMVCIKKADKADFRSIQANYMACHKYKRNEFEEDQIQLQQQNCLQTY